MHLRFSQTPIFSGSFRYRNPCFEEIKIGHVIDSGFPVTKDNDFVLSTIPYTIIFS
jgi:hypothetical protein